jgi:glutaredoxin
MKLSAGKSPKRLQRLHKPKILICFLILASSLFLAGCSAEPSKYDSFAQCLTEKGVKMYGTDWCHYCQNQKKEFGKSFQFVDYVNCDIYATECKEAGVSGYPTWLINGETYRGVQPLYRLASLSGCKLHPD